jgi:tRNA nucleotidyltransferase (CCA-adding enzyme)
MICGVPAPHVMRSFWDVLSVLVPELARQKTFVSGSTSLMEHTIRVLEQVPRTVSMRLAALLHDIAKPYVATPGNDPEQVPDYAEVGARMTAEVLNRLRCDRSIQDRVVHLVRFYHQRPEPSLVSVKQWLRQHPKSIASDLLLLQKADRLARQPDVSPDDLTQLEQVFELVDRVQKERQCHTLQDLVVNGNDLIKMGLKPGRQVGALLDHLLDQVIEGHLTNEREALLRCARKKIGHWSDHQEDG